MLLPALLLLQLLLLHLLVVQASHVLLLLRRLLAVPALLRRWLLRPLLTAQRMHWHFLQRGWQSLRAAALQQLLHALPLTLLAQCQQLLT